MPRGRGRWGCRARCARARSSALRPRRAPAPCRPSAGSCSSTMSSRCTCSSSCSTFEAERGLVRRALRLPQRPAVAGVAVQAVVQPLRHVEELIVALDDHPSGIDAGAADVADQRAQHLRHAAAARGRVDRPERARAEQLPPARDRALELRQPVGRQHLSEALGRKAGDLLDVKWHVASVPARGCTLSPGWRVSPAEPADGVVERLGLLQVAHVAGAGDHDELAVRDRLLRTRERLPSGERASSSPQSSRVGHRDARQQVALVGLGHHARAPCACSRGGRRRPSPRAAARTRTEGRRRTGRGAWGRTARRRASICRRPSTRARTSRSGSDPFQPA